MVLIASVSLYCFGDRHGEPEYPAWACSRAAHQRLAVFRSRQSLSRPRRLRHRPLSRPPSGRHRRLRRKRHPDRPDRNRGGRRLHHRTHDWHRRWWRTGHRHHARHGRLSPGLNAAIHPRRRRSRPHLRNPGRQRRWFHRHGYRRHEKRRFHRRRRFHGDRLFRLDA